MTDNDFLERQDNLKRDMTTRTRPGFEITTHHSLNLLTPAGEKQTDAENMHINRKNGAAER